MNKFWSWIISLFKKSTPAPTPVPVPVPAPVPIKPTPTPAYGKKIDCPEWARGGECPTPAGLDIRYDVACDGDYTFAGDFLAPYTQINRNATGTYSLSLPDVTKNGVLFRCESYNFPSSASPKVKGNSCPAYDRSGTFRFWVQCYDVSGGSPATEPPAKPVTANKPAWTKLSDVPTYTDTSTPATTKPAVVGQFYGSFRVANADEATNARYTVMNWFKRNGYAVGYPTPTNPKSFAIDVSWDTTLPANEPRDLKWEVNP